MKKAYYIRLIIAAIVLLCAILALFGFYPFKIMDLQFSAVLERTIVNFSFICLGIILFLAVLTFLFGRFYCSLICPFGLLQEFITVVFKKKGEKQKNLPFKYFISAIVYGFLIGGTTLLIKYIDPYTIFASAFSLSVFGLVITIVVLIITLFKNRLFCTNICPVGAVLGLISKVSLNKIYIDKESCVSCGMCSKSCPSGCIDHKEKTVDNETCVKCLKCLNKCKKDAIKFGKNKVKFNPKRRELIIAASLVVVFGGAIKAGLEIGKNLAKKVQNIILPPGAIEATSMLNRCLNCNLCVENCPNKILTKANDNFGAVHIDYSKGKGFCEFNCNNCSSVCPAGAIKRMDLKEKQNTRIAMAMIKEEKCVKCGACVKNCPKGAIDRIDDKIVMDNSKCIGCNKCAKVCRFDAIEVFGINEQRRI